MTEEKNAKGSYLPRSWGLGHRTRKTGEPPAGTEPEQQSSDRSVPVTGSHAAEASQDSQAAEYSGPERDLGDSGTFPACAACPESRECRNGTPPALEADFRRPISESPAADEPTTIFKQEESEPEFLRLRTTLAGVRFSYACKIYHFEAGDMELAAGDWVIVKTEKGVGLGVIAVPPFERELDASQLDGLRKILRKAGKVDLDQKSRCVQRESESFEYCMQKIEEMGLPMKLIGVECFFDGTKYIFYFTSEGRVDFRDLVKQLVARFPVRIEMRQIGVRHAAKMVGGLACCGQELCCSRYLTDFRPVSVKMAKTQNLSLNPAKISGVCGRLMCCLGYEHDIYEEFKKGIPKVGKTVRTSSGEGIIQKYNPLSGTISVLMQDETLADIPRAEILGLRDAIAETAADNEDTEDKADLGELEAEDIPDAEPDVT